MPTVRAQPLTGPARSGGRPARLQRRPVDQQADVGGVQRGQLATGPLEGGGRRGPRTVAAAEGFEQQLGVVLGEAERRGPGPVTIPPEGGGTVARGTPAATTTAGATAQANGHRRRGGARRRAADGGDLLLLGDAEGGSAAAGGHDVRVLDLEAGALEAFLVVDVRAVDVLEAVAVDEQLQAVTLEDLVVSRCSSKASWYWKPEHPPPRTPTRSPARATSACWASRNSRTFSAPLSVIVIMASTKV